MQATMTIELRRITAFGLALLLVLPAPAGAEGRGRDQARQDHVLGDCIRQSAGGREWLEKTLWALRDQEGGWIGAEVSNSDGSHDLGPLQVNSWWVPRIAELTGRPQASIRHWLKNDACFNVDAARWIFLTGLATTRNYWEAVGVYHSPTDWRQRRYAASVVRHLKRRFGPKVFGR